MHKLNPYASIQSKYTFARTYANSIFTGSIFEWLPVRSVAEPRNEMKRKGRKENEREKLCHGPHGLAELSLQERQAEAL